IALVPLARSALGRARALRRARGRLSGFLADTVRASGSVGASGAVQRELNAVDRHSRRVVRASVRRSRVTGFVRALTVTVASAWTVLMIVLVSLGAVEAAQLPSLLTLLGVMSMPMSDLGRVV